MKLLKPTWVNHNGKPIFQSIFTLTGPSLQLEDKGRILGRL